MQFTSTLFVIFLLLIVLIYYAFTEKYRWWVLLASSYIFYASFSPLGFLYLVPTTIEVFLFAKWISFVNAKYDAKLSQITDKTEKKEVRNLCKKEKKKILTLALIITFGILCILKYTNFVCGNILSLFNLAGLKINYKPFSFFIPLGLSFYTFSAAGYLFDVYNKKYSAETSLPRFALFMSWFPSIIQGPINRNNQLRSEFFEKEHPFVLENMQFAAQRILWGFLKKLVIADRADQVVTYIFGSYDKLPWFIILFGLFMYAIELYADFAGGMDIALGVSELFGIKLAENFRQPYFATSVADFWRRWHITLGAWMKDYIFYPFSLSNAMMNLSKKLGEKSKYLARIVPACIGNVLIFLLVGIWHGAEWHYIFWGLYQGLIIAFSTNMEPFFKKINVFLHVDEKALYWKIFRIIRTFLIILVGYILDEISDIHQMLGMAKQLFSFTNGKLIENFSYDGFGVLTLLVVFLFSAIWFIVSIMKERGIDVRKKIAAFPLILRWGIYLALILSTPFFQASDSLGFMYANF